MRLFKKAEPINRGTSWQDCVDYLRELHQTDYNKILKVVGTYRDADKKVKKILHINYEPISLGFSNDELVLDDTVLGDFLEDEQPKTTKIEVQ
jgi:DNA-directed RNA polymerase sigma subunit (sigma70/sigma32)